MRTRIALFLSAFALVLLFASAANAKGPVAAKITGPGLTAPLKLSYLSTRSRASMGKLTSDGEFFGQAFTGAGGRVPVQRPPAGSLGPRYLVVYTVPGPNGDSLLRQSLYPYADAGAVTFMAKGQRFWGTRRTRGGWSRGSRALTDALVQAGLPPAPPSTE
jgi:hypothetical protein